MPQLPYFPLTGLSAATVYPMPAQAFVEQETDVLKYQEEIAVEKVDQSASPGNDATIGLSGGEMQKLSLLRVVANKPSWTFLDEPSSALDECSASKMLQFLGQHLPETTFIIVAHSLPTGILIHRTIDFG